MSWPSLKSWSRAQESTAVNALVAADQAWVLTPVRRVTFEPRLQK